jgi:hypothetical protein
MQNGGSGGTGVQSNITGTNTYYAGGGGGAGAQQGARQNQYAGGNGGAGGGGVARTPDGWRYIDGEEAPTDEQRCANEEIHLSVFNGTANSGGGGSGRGGNGGSGIVIMRIPTANFSSSSGASVTTSGDDSILVFNSSGYFVTQ